MDTALHTAPAPVRLSEAFKYWLKLGFISFGGPGRTSFEDATPAPSRTFKLASTLPRMDNTATS